MTPKPPPGGGIGSGKATESFVSFGYGELVYNGFITSLKSRFINRGQPKINRADAVTDVKIGSEGIDPSELNGMHETHSPAVGLELTNQLTNCARELISSCKSVESSFLTLGQDLQSIHSDATDLNQRTINANPPPGQP